MALRTVFPENLGLAIRNNIIEYGQLHARQASTIFNKHSVDKHKNPQAKNRKYQIPNCSYSSPCSPICATGPILKEPPKPACVPYTPTCGPCGPCGPFVTPYCPPSPEIIPLSAFSGPLIPSSLPTQQTSAEQLPTPRFLSPWETCKSPSDPCVVPRGSFDPCKICKPRMPPVCQPTCEKPLPKPKIIHVPTKEELVKGLHVPRMQTICGPCGPILEPCADDVPSKPSLPPPEKKPKSDVTRKMDSRQHVCRLSLGVVTKDTEL